MQYNSNDYSQQQNYGSGPTSPCYAPTPVPQVGGADTQQYYSQMVMNAANFESYPASNHSGSYNPSPMAMQYSAMQQQHQHPGYSPYQQQQQQQYQSYSSQHSSVPASNTKRYAHNPYANSATTSEPSSPAMSASASFSSPADAIAAPSLSLPNTTSAAMNGSLSSVQSSSQGSPIYAPEGSFSDIPSSNPMAHSVSEQFQNLRGSICAAAMTTRGRHVLIATMRLQHVDKIAAMFEELLPNLGTLMMDQNGCNVIRTLIEFLTEQQISQLVAYLTPEVVISMATASQHTRRILQTIFERHHGPALQPLIDTISNGAVSLSTTQQGCIALMRVLENAIEPQRLQVLHALGPHIAGLTMDPYGNYVIQTIVTTFPREVSCEVLEKSFEGSWVGLSCNKFASNVMEKLINTATPLTRKTILDELIFNATNLNLIMQDGFGNFVLQAIIDTCTTGTEYRRIFERIRPQLATSPYGHKIEAKLKSKRFGPGGARVGGSSNNGNNSNGGRRGGNNNNNQQQQQSSASASASAQQGPAPRQQSSLAAAMRSSHTANSSTDGINTPSENGSTA